METQKQTDNRKHVSVFWLDKRVPAIWMYIHLAMGFRKYYLIRHGKAHTISENLTVFIKF